MLSTYAEAFAMTEETGGFFNCDVKPPAYDGSILSQLERNGWYAEYRYDEDGNVTMLLKEFADFWHKPKR